MGGLWSLWSNYNQMLLSHKEVLKTCNYYISYNFLENKQGVINVSWADKAVYIIKWNETLQAVITNWQDQTIFCPRYAAPEIAYTILLDICKHYKYPHYWVHYALQNNPSSTFFFDVVNNDEDRKLAKDVGDIAESIRQSGIKPEDVAMAKEFGVWDGVKSIIQHNLGVYIYEQQTAGNQRTRKN